MSYSGLWSQTLSAFQGFGLVSHSYIVQWNCLSFFKANKEVPVIPLLS